MLKDVRIPLEPLVPHLRDHLVRSEMSCGAFDRKMGFPTDTTRILLAERSRTIEFNQADKIVCAVNPFLWRSDPVLARIYQEVDFSEAREYDEETQFPCGHPRTEGNFHHYRRRDRPSPAVVCLICSRGRQKKYRAELGDQLSLIRDAA